MSHSQRPQGEKEGTASLENVEVACQETVPQNGLTDDDLAFLSSISQKKANQIYRKVDYRLVPMLAILYLVALIDRANIGNAKIEGLEASLGMSGTDYNVALAIFFPPYILLEIPSNHILSKFKRPSYYMGTLVVSWGIVMTLTGVVPNFGGLCATRFFLGVCEAGFFPGATHIISEWYPPDRTQKRLAIFYTASAAAGAFSGLLAYAIVNMHGVGGYEGWRWIFLIEGLASVIAGVACFFILPDAPRFSQRWLEPEDIRYLELRHAQTRGRAHARSGHKFDLDILGAVLKDWKLYLLGFVFMSNTGPNYGMKFTMPQIIKSMGFSSSTAQLLTAPPYAVGAASSLISAIYADKYNWRMPFIVPAQLVVILGYCMLVAKAAHITDNIALCYTAIHIVCAGLYPIPPGTVAWTMDNLVPAKRAMGIALMVSWGNMGGIIGSFIFLEKEKPSYPTGFGTSLALAGLGAVSCLVLEVVYHTINKRRELVDEASIREKYTDEELEDMHEGSPLFRHSL